MMATRNILGIDPGETTGWAVVAIRDDGSMAILGYGTIALTADNWPDALVQTGDGIEGLLHGDEEISDIAIEAGIIASGIPTSPKANEVRGVVKYVCSEHRQREGNTVLVEYQPNAIKAVIRDKKMTKADTRKWIAGLFGVPALKSPDMADAIAVAAAHGVKLYAARFPYPGFVATSAAGKSKQKKSDPNDLLNLPDDVLKAGIKDGTFELCGRKLRRK
jgi:Holliday junction resolvasome RuvABC endonuclease subunit